MAFGSCFGVLVLSRVLLIVLSLSFCDRIWLWLAACLGLVLGLGPEPWGLSWVRDGAWPFCWAYALALVEMWATYSSALGSGLRALGLCLALDFGSCLGLGVGLGPELAFGLGFGLCFVLGLGLKLGIGIGLVLYFLGLNWVCARAWEVNRWA